MFVLVWAVWLGGASIKCAWPMSFNFRLTNACLLRCYILLSSCYFFCLCGSGVIIQPTFALVRVVRSD